MKQTQDEVILNAEQVREDALRAETALLNHNEMSKLMGRYGLLIRAKHLPMWRATQRVKGDIDGVHEALTIIATDGVLGWFLTYDEEPWCGHIQCFSGDVKPLFTFGVSSSKSAKTIKRKGKSRRQQILDSL